MMRRISAVNSRNIARAVLVSTLAVLLLGAATRLDPVPLGLNAEFFRNAGRAGAPDAAALDTDISGGRLLRQWQGAPPEVFSASWTGTLTPLSDGDYVLSAASDTTSTIILDGRVVGIQGFPGAPPARGSLHLSAGAHPLIIEYSHHGGPVLMDFLWARDQAALTPVPAWALRPRRIHSVARLAARALLDRALALSEWSWVAALLIAAAAIARLGLRRLRDVLAGASDWPALRWILGASLVLNLAGIWWGLPGTWVAIELKPTYIIAGLSQHFSHGWYDAYPPVHFYLLAAAMSPMLLLQALDRITFDSPETYALLVLISRLVSVALAAGMVAAAGVCGTRAFGRRAGLFAAATVAVTTPFLYYAKTANVDVPYLFWWALSMVCYLRLLETGRTTDYAGFAAAATLSVCTKDQAYGLYLFAPLVIVEQIWRVNRRAGVPRALLRSVFDRRILIAAMTSAGLFAVCNNLIFNLAGFVEHVRYITGPGSALYRVYEPTPAGHLALLRETLTLIEISMGWPLCAVGVIGLALALADARLRRMAIWLIAPAAAYYLGFIDVILYNYDRFVLPMCFVLAIFGGLAFDRALSSGRVIRRLGAAAAAGAFAYTLLYAGTVDVLMIEDARYDAEGWMRAHVGRQDLVGISGLHEYLPRLDDFHLEDIGTVAELRQEHPEYVVLNADYARAVPADTEWGQMIAGLQHDTIGYRRVGLFRHASPWPWLPAAHPDLTGARQETVVFSTLRNINPTIEIFQRER